MNTGESPAWEKGYQIIEKIFRDPSLLDDNVRLERAIQHSKAALDIPLMAAESGREQLQMLLDRGLDATMKKSLANALLAAVNKMEAGYYDHLDDNPEKKRMAYQADLIPPSVRKSNYFNQLGIAINDTRTAALEFRDMAEGMYHFLYEFENKHDNSKLKKFQEFLYNEAMSFSRKNSILKDIPRRVEDAFLSTKVLEEMNTMANEMKKESKDPVGDFVAEDTISLSDVKQTGSRQRLDKKFPKKAVVGDSMATKTIAKGSRFGVAPDVETKPKDPKGDDAIMKPEAIELVMNNILKPLRSLPIKKPIKKSYILYLLQETKNAL